MLISLFFFGNPDRGDDAAGELLYQWASDHFSNQDSVAEGVSLRLISDFQLEPEHIFDLDGCDLGIFVDSHSASEKSLSWERIQTGSQLMFSSHSLCPESLLFLYESTLKKAAPVCYLLGIEGKQYELGTSLSRATQESMMQAKEHLKCRLKDLQFSPTHSCLESR